MGSPGNQEFPSNPSPIPSPAWVGDLEEMRRQVIGRLLAIEDLARRQSTASSGEGSRLVQSLKERIEELERDRNRLRADVDREEGDWKRMQAQFENDRQLLAEAWEKLERARLEGASNPAASPARHAPVGQRPRPHDDPSAHGPAPLRTTEGGETGNPVAETILRQFQVLCSDVRRTTDARCSSG